MTPCPARTRSLTKRARRAPSKDPVSFDSVSYTHLNQPTKRIV